MNLRVAFLVGTAVLAVACGGGLTAAPTPAPTPGPAAPTVTAVAVSGVSGAPAAGGSATLVATATMSDGTTQVVTAQATWASSDANIATVSATGQVQFVAAGDVEFKATHRNVTGSLKLTVGPKPPNKFTLRGAMTDGVNGKGIRDVTVRILDGPNAGRSAATDDAGAFVLADLIESTFTVRISQAFYDSVDRVVVLNGDARLDVSMKPALNVSGFYGTFNVSLSVIAQNCEFPVEPGSSGQLSISGRNDGSGLNVSLTERGTTRSYGGSMGADGKFGAGGSGTIGLKPLPSMTTLLSRVIYTHSYSGGIDGQVSGRNVSATESINYGDPCPGKILRIGINGSK